MANVRLNANEAIDQFILGCEAANWSHGYIDDDVVPYCDIANHRICSPVMPSMIDAKIDQIVRGKNEHEAGHAKLTPCDKNPSWSALKGSLVNVLEDLRIEKGLKGMSASIENDLNAMNRFFISKQQTAFQTGEYDGIKPVNEALTALHFAANGFPPEWSLSPEAQKYYDDALPIFGEWVDADCNTKNGFGKIEEIADRIILRWNESRSEMNMQQPQGNGGQADGNGDQQNGEGGNGNQQGEGNQQGGSSDQQNGDGRGNSQPDGGGQSGDGKEGQGDSQSSDSTGDQQGEGGESQGDQQGDGENGQPCNDQPGRGNGERGRKGEGRNGRNVCRKHKNPNGGSAKNGKSLEDDFVDNDNEAEAIRKELEQIFNESKTVFGDYKPYTAEDALVRAMENEGEFNAAFSKIRGATAKLSSYLEQSLKTLSRCRVMHDRDKGFLSVNENAANICKSLTKNLFSKKVKGISLDTSVSILIDESGSIGYNTSREFQKIVIAFCEVLDRLGIKFEVLGHTTDDTMHCPSNAGFTRTSKLVMFEHKNFGETYRSERYRLGSIDYHYCNIDGEALLETFKRNLAQRSGRHVILVFSDGLPNDNSCRHAVLYRNLTDTIGLCRKNGVEVYAFGVGTRDPEKFYGEDNFVYLSSVDEMTNAFFRRTAEIITSGRAH